MVTIMSKHTANRREAIKSLLAIYAAGALAACSPGSKEASESKDLTYAASGQFLGSAEMALLSGLAQTIMPETDTAGAIEAGVPQTLQSLVSEWGDDGIRLYWRAGLRNLSNVLGSKFATLSSAERHDVLSAYDAQVFGDAVDDKFYKDMKAGIVSAYYMSEPGATQELHYDPVPGDFKGCVPFSEIGKAWAT